MELEELLVSARPFLSSLGGGPGAGLFDMAAMAALTTCTVGGLIPQAKQGGMGVREARAGSKLEGTGLEKEHIGHTQVALAGGGGAGLPCRGGVLDEAGGGGGGAEMPRDSCFKGLGNSVILAEDLRKPACGGCQSVMAGGQARSIHRSRSCRHP